MKPPYSPRRSGCTRSNRTQSPLSPARARASRPSAGVRSGRRRSRDIPVAEAECLAMRSAGSTSAARPSIRGCSKRMPHRSQAQRGAGRPSAQWKCAQHFDIEDPIQKPGRYISATPARHNSCGGTLAYATTAREAAIGRSRRWSLGSALWHCALDAPRPAGRVDEIALMLTAEVGECTDVRKRSGAGEIVLCFGGSLASSGMYRDLLLEN